MSDIDDQAIFAQVGDLAVTEAPDGYIIDHSERGTVHFLNPTAVLVYESCDGKRSVGEIVALVQRTFGLEEPPAEAVKGCLADLHAQHLVLPCTP
ncbi:MAG: PqqD family protein [Hyphomicrobiales bacterium]